MLPYYTIDEIAEKSGLSRDQVIRLGFAGQLVFSIRKHTPQNYKETEETRDSDGSRIVRTRTQETQAIVKPDGPALCLSYISPEDVINIITNDAPNRKTLVRATYQTRDLNPKQGTWQFNNPIELSPPDLIVCAEEWEIFMSGPGKHLKAQTPLVLPEKITLKWLVNNLTIAQWLGVATMVTSAFGLGVYLGQTPAYQKLVAMFQPVSDEVQVKPKPSSVPTVSSRPESAAQLQR